MTGFLQPARGRLIVIASVLALAGCASGPMSNERAATAARAAVQAEHWSKAEQMLAADRLRDAIEHLWIVDAVAPNAPARRRIATLEATVAARMTRLGTGASAAFERQDHREGMRLLLHMLALQPDNPEVLTRLRTRYRTHAERGLLHRPVAVALPPTSVAAQGQQQLDLEAVAAEASALFEQGLGLLDENPDAAKALFHEALELDPTHLGARAFLHIVTGP